MARHICSLSWGNVLGDAPRTVFHLARVYPLMSTCVQLAVDVGPP